MTTAVIEPSWISGEVFAPASKSAMQRACALAVLNKGTTSIYNPGNSDDDRAAIDIIQKLGASVNFADNLLIVKSSGTIQPAGEIDCRESGLSLRMFAAIAALSNKSLMFIGRGSLLSRPIHFFEEVFPLLAVSATTNRGFLPLHLKGPLVPKPINIDGSRSSQYLTGLLFAFAKAATEPVSIAVSGLKSKPYIDLSLQMMEHFGYKVKHDKYLSFFIEPVIQSQQEINYTVEGDWSGAAFLLVAGAIAGDIRLKGLDAYSAQADRVIVDVMISAGAKVSVEGSCFLVNNKSKLKAFEFDATDCPDLFPPLAALAAYCKGTSSIKGVSRLASKESDRAASLQNVFSKMGVDISVDGDVMHIGGGNEIKAADVSSHHDHRIAMAAAVAALSSTGTTVITNAEAVNKSYPRFFDHLKMLGASVSLIGQ